MLEQVTAEYLRSLPTKELTALASKQIWLHFLRKAPAEIRRFGRSWGVSKEKIEETIRYIQQLEGDTMLKHGDKIRIYVKGTKKLYAEFTVREYEPTKDGCYKVWVEESLGEGPPLDLTKFVAIVGDDEYDISSGWSNSPEDSGLILRPIAL